MSLSPQSFTFSSEAGIRKRGNRISRQTGSMKPSSSVLDRVFGLQPMGVPRRGRQGAEKAEDKALNPRTSLRRI